MRLKERTARPGPIEAISMHSPMVDRLDSVGGIRAVVHVAVLCAGKALQEGGADAHRKGDSLVKDYAMRRLREDLPYLLLALSSSSPEGAESRTEAVEGLRILRDESGNTHASALASRLLAAIQAEDANPVPSPRAGGDEIRKAVLAVEAAEAALSGEMDQFEESRRKITRHRAYEGVEALIPQMLLSLDSERCEEWSLKGLGMLRDRVTPLVRPGALLSRLVLEKMGGASAHPQMQPERAAEASVDLAQ